MYTKAAHARCPYITWQRNEQGVEGISIDGVPRVTEVSKQHHRWHSVMVLIKRKELIGTKYCIK